HDGSRCQHNGGQQTDGRCFSLHEFLYSFLSINEIAPLSTGETTRDRHTSRVLYVFYMHELSISLHDLLIANQQAVAVGYPQHIHPISKLAQVYLPGITLLQQ